MKSVTQGNQIRLPRVWAASAYVPSEAFWNTQACTTVSNISHFYRMPMLLMHSSREKKDKTGFLQCLTALTEQPKARFLAASFWLCSPPLACMLPPVRSQICSPPQHWRIPLQCCALEALGVQWGWKDSSPACSWDILVWVSFPAPIKTGPACQAGLASSKQPHLCMSKLPELNQESLTEKLYHRFIAHSLQNSLVQVSILGNSQEQAVASTICRVCTNKRCWQN